VSRFDKIPTFKLDHDADCSGRFRQVHKAYWELHRHCADEVLALCIWRSAAIVSWIILAACLLVGCGSPKQPEQSCISKPPDGYYSVEDKGQICWKSKGWVCVPKCPT